MRGNDIVYAICFDLDNTKLEANYAKSFTNAYADIRKFLESKGFTHQQGSVYFGDKEKVDDVVCMMAAFELAKKYDWFTPCVKDLRMLRIEDNNDLLRVLSLAKL